MKKFSFATGLFIVFFIVLQSCAGSAQVREGAADFGEVERRDWILLEVRTPDETIYMDRAKLDDGGLAGVYTAHFEEGRLSGMGAPNRYFGPYTLSENMTLSIGDIASTMIFSFLQPEGLSEHEFFTLLSGVTSWDLVEGCLELYSTRSDGTEAALVFVSF